MKRRKITAALLSSTALPGCTLLPPPWGTGPVPLPAEQMPPAAPREFRGAWVASVVNIDWPSRPGLPPEQQQAEMRAMLDRARTVGLNAIVLQVRPTADALYASTLEPWSEYLTGTQGVAPSPYYDPLEAWVREAHARGIELHAWFNPYRAWHPSAKSPPAATHVATARPELVRRYGDLLWLDPGEAAAAAHTLAVIADVVKRYDIDGVHVDDYFYPYPVRVPGTDNVQPFPDDAPYQRYREQGGGLERDDWRRDNVDRLIQAMVETVHFVKPQLRVGISPFGLPKPALRPPGIEGFSQFDKLYADVERWVEKGWYDYLAPQLYWAIDRPAQAFAVLMDYWQSRVGPRRHHFPGLYTSSVGGVAGGNRNWPASEIVNQVTLMRRAGVRGHIHFSMIALMQDRGGVATALRQGHYREPALPPASPWLDDRVPPAPRVTGDARGATVAPGPGDTPFVWAIWRRVEGRWRFAVQPAPDFRVERQDADALVLSSVSRSGQEGERIGLRWA